MAAEPIVSDLEGEARDAHEQGWAHYLVRIKTVSEGGNPGPMLWPTQPGGMAKPIARIETRKAPCRKCNVPDPLYRLGIRLSRENAHQALSEQSRIARPELRPRSERPPISDCRAGLP